MSSSLAKPESVYPATGALSGVEVSQPKRTVLIVEERELVREALRTLLERHDRGEVVAMASDTREAARYAGAHKPSVTLVYPDSPFGMGVDTATHETLMGMIRSIQEAAPETKVVLISEHGNLDEICEAIQAGAYAVIDSREPLEDVLRALEAIFGGSPHMPSGIAYALVRGEREKIDELTPRELEVLTKVAYGHTNAVIASELHISVRTVESHRASIQARLGLDTRAELVRYALDAGLIR
ncbi:MAG: response regulator [Actinobacteria bacterium]|uniref:Unannotated protein n=1 Tax=freshwater metagenome TaxID=449393 RepID=A0A6J7EBW9_9ZZZZ|nr:response regulator [Actinomycetota bacterium]